MDCSGVGKRGVWGIKATPLGLKKKFRLFSKHCQNSQNKKSLNEK